MQRLVTHVTEHQRARLDAEKERSGLTLSDINRRALDNYFQDHEQASKQPEREPSTETAGATG